MSALPFIRESELSSPTAVVLSSSRSYSFVGTTDIGHLLHITFIPINRSKLKLGTFYNFFAIRNADVKASGQPKLTFFLALISD